MYCLGPVQVLRETHRVCVAVHYAGALYQAVEVFLSNQDLSSVLELTQFSALQLALKAVYEDPVILYIQRGVTAPVPPARPG